MQREIKQERPSSFFGGSSHDAYENAEATREMRPQLPFIISGGSVTELYYFRHIHDLTEYKFDIRPQFFGYESNYTKVFERNIDIIRREVADALIYCVFDWDTIYDSEENRKKHKQFCEKVKKSIESGTVRLCPSMPCIEYWFLLHFEDTKELFKDCKTVIETKMKDYALELFDIKSAWNGLFKKKKLVDPKDWVEKLLADNKLNLAIERAKSNIDDPSTIPDDRSFSYIYKIFDEYK